MSYPPLLPCPFCGTNPDEKPGKEVYTSRGLQFECSGCEALWPPIRRSDVVGKTDEEIAAHLNRRAPNASGD